MRLALGAACWRRWRWQRRGCGGDDESSGAARRPWRRETTEPDDNGGGDHGDDDRGDGGQPSEPSRTRTARSSRPSARSSPRRSRSRAAGQDADYEATTEFFEELVADVPGRDQGRPGDHREGMGRDHRRRSRRLDLTRGPSPSADFAKLQALSLEVRHAGAAAGEDEPRRTGWRRTAARTRRRRRDSGSDPWGLPPNAARPQFAARAGRHSGAGSRSRRRAARAGRARRRPPFRSASAPAVRSSPARSSRGGGRTALRYRGRARRRGRRAGRGSPTPPRRAPGRRPRSARRFRAVARPRTRSGRARRTPRRLRG